MYLYWLNKWRHKSLTIFFWVGVFLILNRVSWITLNGSNANVYACDQPHFWEWEMKSFSLFDLFRINVTIFKFVVLFHVENERKRERIKIITRHSLNGMKVLEGNRQQPPTTIYCFFCCNNVNIRMNWSWRGKNWNLRFLERVAMTFPAAIMPVGRYYLSTCAQINQVHFHKEALKHFHLFISIWLPLHYTLTAIIRSNKKKSQSHSSF